MRRISVILTAANEKIDWNLWQRVGDGFRWICFRRFPRNCRKLNRHDHPITHTRLAYPGCSLGSILSLACALLAITATAEEMVNSEIMKSSQGQSAIAADGHIVLSSKINPGLASRLRHASSNEKIRVVVEFAAPLDPSRDLRTKARRAVRAATIFDARRSALGWIKSRMTMEQRNSLSQGVRRNLQYFPYFVFEGTTDEIKVIAQQTEVISVFEDLVLHPTLAVSTGESLVNAVSTRTSGFIGEGQAIAILDSGVASNHEFLGGRVVAEGCFVEGCLSEQGVGAAMPVTPQAALDTRPFHGTHVAGIAAGYDSSTFSGMAPGAEIIAVRVTREDSVADSVYASDLAAGLEFVFGLRNDHSIAAINMSNGTQQEFSDAQSCDAAHPALTAIANTIAAVDIALVASSGNYGDPDGRGGAIGLPGCLSATIAVGATNYADEVAPFTKLSAQVDLLAPGVSIESANGFTNEYAERDGTSFAAPHVAGAFTVLKAAKPSASVAEILTALQAGGVIVNETRTTEFLNVAGVLIPGAETTYSIPRIDVYNALIELGVTTEQGFAVVPLNGYTVVPVGQ